MTTYTDFLTDLAALSISGVTRRFEMGYTPPASLNAGECPAQWVQAPSGEGDPVVFGPSTVWPHFKAQVIIAVQPVAQSIMALVWQDAVTIMDAAVTTLGGDTTGQALAGGPTAYRMKLGRVTVAGTDFWAVIIDVETEG